MNFIHPPSQQVFIHCTNILVTSPTKEERRRNQTTPSSALKPTWAVYTRGSKTNPCA
jgi:hypothetical protein